ncbi:hypothetical protein HK099_008375 [Clydaea vesicula]|uniref:Uncharacterized protein n=1 Tax=Clydaea vesicula TaxID=447962 RepID=A0AAD5U4Y1_9FUNG|nr:hypothetical protein HK099_008375 [Clydaea vesicula]
MELDYLDQLIKDIHEDYILRCHCLKTNHFLLNNNLNFKNNSNVAASINFVNYNNNCEHNFIENSNRLLKDIHCAANYEDDEDKKKFFNLKSEGGWFLIKDAKTLLQIEEFNPASIDEIDANDETDTKNNNSKFKELKSETDLVFVNREEQDGDLIHL